LRHYNQRLEEETAITPQLCCIEVNNILRLFEKRKLITSLDLEKTIAFVDRLPILRDRVPIDFYKRNGYVFTINTKFKIDVII
jgi:hypothetical protein